MNILSIDTTTKNAAVSIKKDNEIFEESINNEITHSEKLLPLIDKTLKKANLTLKDIDSYACINGPGSFTGIRIGLSTLKAFAHVENKKIFAISTLDALSLKVYFESAFYKNKKDIYIASLIDAKNDRAYFNFSKLSLNSNNKIEIENIIDISNSYISDALENILEKVKENNISDIIFAGDVVEKKSSDIQCIFDKDKMNYYIKDTYPTTSDLLNAIENISNINNYTFDAFSLNAIYARLSQAERVKNNEK